MSYLVIVFWCQLCRVAGDNDEDLDAHTGIRVSMVQHEIPLRSTKQTAPLWTASLGIRSNKHTAGFQS